MPFGSGPRLCLGQSFAELQLKLLIAVLSRDYDLELGHPLDDMEQMMKQMSTLDGLARSLRCDVIVRPARKGCNLHSVE
jgi:cytochrome P450